MTDPSIQPKDQDTALTKLSREILSGTYTTAERLEAKLAPLITPQAVNGFGERERLLLFTAYQYFTYLRPNKTQSALDLIQFGDRLLATGLSAWPAGVINVHLAEVAGSAISRASGVTQPADLIERSLRHAEAAASFLEQFRGAGLLKEPLIVPALIAVATVASELKLRKGTDSGDLETLRLRCSQVGQLVADVVAHWTVVYTSVNDLTTLCKALTMTDVPSVDHSRSLELTLTRLMEATSLRGRDSLATLVEGGLRRIFSLQNDAGRHLDACLTALKLNKLADRNLAASAKADNYLVDAFEQALSASNGPIADRIFIDFMSRCESGPVDLTARLRFFSASPSIEEFGPHSKSELRSMIIKGIISKPVPTSRAAFDALVKLFFQDRFGTLGYLAEVHDLAGNDSATTHIIVMNTLSLLAEYEKTRPTAEEISKLRKETPRLPQEARVELNLMLARSFLDKGDTTKAKLVTQRLERTLDGVTIEAAEARLILAAAHLSEGDFDSALNWANKASEHFDIAGIYNFLDTAIRCYIHHKQHKPTKELLAEAAKCTNRIGDRRYYRTLRDLNTLEAICQMVHDRIKNRSLHRWHRDSL